MSANMDVLVVLGTSAAYGYSILGIIIHFFDTDFEVHLYFETSVLLITFIMLGRQVNLLNYFSNQNIPDIILSHLY